MQASEFGLNMLRDLISNPQFYHVIGVVLLIINGVFSAFISELLTKRKAGKGKKGTFLIIFLSIITFVALALFTVLLLWIVFRFLPQKEEFPVLIKKIFSSHVKEFVFPLIAAAVAGICFRKVLEGSRGANVLLCIFLIFSTVLNSILFFWNSFRLIQRPQYSVPIESISSIINSRLKTYPFIFSSEALKNLGDGSRLFGEVGGETGDFAGSDSDGAGDWQTTEYEEPNNFQGYLSAIIDGTYAPGMSEADYLHKAYNLFIAGRHNNNFFYMGVMWYYIGFDLSDFEEISITWEECFENSIEAYQRDEEQNGGSGAVYHNMALIYEQLGDQEKMRDCLHKSLEYYKNESETPDENIEREVSVYKDYIFDWMSQDNYANLMNDAAVILEYKNDLSMYVLYGAYAIAQNTEIENAYKLLCDADEYFQGKSAIIKILKCISADLLGIDESGSLYDIYNLEETNGLTTEEEAYLIRYLFAANRTDELWGYIVDIETVSNPELDVIKMEIKACCYFKDADRVSTDSDNAKELLAQIDAKLDDQSVSAEDRETLLLSRTLLRNCLGQIEYVDMEDYETGDLSEIDYIFLATNAFNNGKYPDAIEYCKTYIEAENEQHYGVQEEVWKKLAPQEKVVLLYYMQLILANSYFEYAIYLGKDSEQGHIYMELAEKECAVFNQSSKSLFYIGEQFKILKNSIDLANGKLPEGTGENVEVYLNEEL